MTARNIRIQAGDAGTFDAYLAEPEGGQGPGLVVLQEIFGVNADIRRLVDRFAAAGFIAAAPDIFWRQEPGLQLSPAVETDRGRAMQLLQGLDEGRAMQDVAATIAHLRALPSCTGKVGAVGYCMGGKLAYLAAGHGADAAVSYYGVGIQGALGEAANLRAPVLLHIAADDHLCPPDAQSRIVETFQNTSGVTVMIHPGVGHAFAREGGATYDAAATLRAESATIDFLNFHLRSA